MSLANLDSTQIVFLAVVVLVTLFLLLRTSRYFTRPKSPDPSWSSIARKPREPSAHVSDIPQEMANWQVEMHEFVREIKAELDSKMRALQAITAEADRAAARLEAALHNSPLRASTESWPEERSEIRAAFSSAQSPKNEITSEFVPFRPKLARSAPGIDLSNLPTSQAESLHPARVSRGEHSSAQAKKEEIHTLADYGLSPAEIAARVGHPIGEVELILNLRGRK